MNSSPKAGLTDSRHRQHRVEGVDAKFVRKISQAGDVALRVGSPTLTVVIPCYNYARYLGCAIESVLGQPGVSADVVVVDDASTDNSLEVASAFAAKDSRVQVVAHAVNAGPVKTFNDGLAVADGEYLVRLDADDLLTPGSLKRSVELLQAYPSVGLVYGHPIHFSGSALPTPRTTPTAWTVWPGQQWLRDRCRDAYNVITSPEVVMRASVVQRVGGQKDLAHTHDMEMWLRIAAHSDVAYIHGADQAWHREHDKSLSSREVDHRRDLVERMDAFEILFDGISDVLPDAHLHRRSAARAMAGQALAFACRELDRGRESTGRVEEFVAIAKANEPQIATLPEWEAYLARLAISPAVRRWHPRSLLARLTRRLDHARCIRKWHKDGVLRD